MSDFTDYVQKELPFRPSIDEIAATGSILVKKDNSYSRDYEALDQGDAGKYLKSQGTNQPPIWDTVSSGIIEKINDNTGTIVFGQPIYIKSNGNIDLAKGDVIATAKVAALVLDTTILTTASGNIQTAGILEGTTGLWDAVTGDSGGLNEGLIYFLSVSTAGMLTTTPPTTGITYPIGLALSTTELLIQFGTMIRNGS